MKILTEQEQQAHYNETVKGGLIGGTVGLAVATAGVYAGALRFPIIRHLTLPMRAFLVTSGGTFAAITTADRYSRAYELSRNPAATYKDENERFREELSKEETQGQKVKDWFKEHRYQLVGGSWAASIAASFAIVGRSPHLTTQQKIVQARVYAQGFTLLVMVGLAAFEISDKNKGQGRWETVRVIDPNDPEHKRIIEKQVHHEEYEGEDQWRDMVEAEERRLKQREKSVQEIRKKEHKQSDHDKTHAKNNKSAENSKNEKSKDEESSDKQK